MHIHVNDVVKVNLKDYPICEVDIEKFLDKNITMLTKYFPDDTVAFETNTIVTDGGICYDKRRMSYEILKGIVACKNKSIRYFTDILSASLTNDYNIPCTITDYDEPSDHLSQNGTKNV